jgi:hypothetical protein
MAGQRRPGRHDTNRIVARRFIGRRVPAVWVTGIGVTYEVDEATGRIVRTISTPGTFPDGCGSGIAAGAGAVWVTRPTGGAESALTGSPRLRRQGRRRAGCDGTEPSARTGPW